MLLSESPAPSDPLVILLIGMRGEERDMRASLEVETPGAYLRFRHEYRDRALGEPEKPLFLEVVRISPRYLDCIGNQVFQQIALGIQVAPNEGLALFGGYEFGYPFGALGDRIAPLFSLLS